MNVVKKIALCVGWIGLSLVAMWVFPTLREHGTTEINNAGFFRLIGLSLFLVLFVAVPWVLALSTWFNRPTHLYKRFM